MKSAESEGSEHFEQMGREGHDDEVVHIDELQEPHEFKVEQKADD